MQKQLTTRLVTRIAITFTALVFGGALLPASAAEQNVASKPDFTRGVKLWASNCARCHNVRDPKDMRDDQWQLSVYHMRLRAGLTGQDTRDILKFLQESN